MDFIEEKLERIIKELGIQAQYEETAISGWCFKESGYTHGGLPSEDGRWEPVDENTGFRGEDTHFWLRTHFRTPERDPARTLYFTLSTDHRAKWDADNPQVMVFLNGESVQGMDGNHLRCELLYEKEYDVYLCLHKKGGGRLHDFLPSLLKVDDAIDRLYYDMKVPYDCASLLDSESESYRTILPALNRAASLLDFRERYSEAYYAGIRAATEYLEREFYGKACGKSDAEVYCVGHTHIDVAWLWTLAETREKVQRSFSTVLKLMEKYPEYIFMSSQLYQFVKENDPALYAKIRAAVAEGRWEPEGAMWLEADCNLTGGESLIRQILFGKRFFKEEFGIDSHILWLPDAFGFSAALPQIMKKSGIDTFITSKISWNETNRMPYDVFLWQGLDGSEVFSFFLTAQKYQKGAPRRTITAYNGMLSPDFVYGAWDRFQQKEYANEVLLTYGYGDGGGGPTEEMLKTQRRLSYGIPGMPKTKMTKAADFAETVRKDFAARSGEWNRLPRWVGELYLEYHRGTYTGMAKNKRSNRKSELLYQTAEIFSTIAETRCGYRYEKDALRAGWEKILLNQFHDILPGSSIAKVYEDSDRDYEFIFETGERVLSGALQALTHSIRTDKEFIVFNPHSYPASGIVTVDGGQMYAENVPPFGWKAVNYEEHPSEVAVSGRVMENRFYRIVFDEGYRIVSCFDKEAEREMAADGGKLNRICAYEDYPKTFDAWDINEYYIDKAWEVDDIESAEPVSENCRAGLKITKRFGKSRILQTVYLYNDIKRVDFETELDWHEDHILLKAEFDFNIHTDELISGTQFGSIKRPTHRNTSWDKAKFEVCAHKWVDLSESNYGIALLNDCKYGHSAKGNQLTLSLLKCATDPNETADQGHHTFRYAIYSHSVPFDRSDVIKEAYSFDHPLIAKKSASRSGADEAFSFARVDSGDVIIETVKKAEDGNGIILRMFESKNQQERIRVSFAEKLRSAAVCNLLEEEETALSIRDNGVLLSVHPFEIITLRVQLKETDKEVACDGSYSPVN